MNEVYKNGKSDGNPICGCGPKHWPQMFRDGPPSRIVKMAEKMIAEKQRAAKEYFDAKTNGPEREYISGVISTWEAAIGIVMEAY